MRSVALKTEVPETIRRYAGTRDDIYAAWRGRNVEPYGQVLPPYSDESPYNRPHVAIRLDLPGTAAFTVAALDEFAEPLNVSRLPEKPSYGGMHTPAATIHDACGY